MRAGSAWPAAVDADTDGVPDSVDNCRLAANADQNDADTDRTGEACDNAKGEFNFYQSDGNGNGIGDVADTGTPPSLVVKRVQIRAPKGGRSQWTVRGEFDTTELGGVDGLRNALKQGFAVAIAGGGLSEPQPIFFPPCPSVSSCQAPNGSARFLRVKATNIFQLKVSGFNQTFSAPLSASPVTGTLSLGGLDRDDTASTCSARLRGRNVTCR